MTMTSEMFDTASPLRTGTWVVDSSRAVVAFSGKASFLTPTVSARFLGVTGSVTVPGNDGRGYAGGEVDVEVDVRTLTTGNRAWDEAITALDPFDSRRHSGA